MEAEKQVIGAYIDPPITDKDPLSKKDDRIGRLIIQVIDKDYKSSHNLYLPIVHFETNQDLFKKIATALTNHKPILQPIYLEPGEKYGVSDQTIVRSSKTLIKDFVITQKGRTYNLADYVVQVALTD